MTIRLSIAASCLALGLSSAAAEPLVKRNVVRYDVSGSTPEEIRAELDRAGPIEQMTTRRFDATTRWVVKWTYRYRNVGQDCAIARVAVTVDIATTVPRLKAGSSAPPALARTFAEYAEKLLEHEQGHVQNAIETGKRIEAAILGMQPHPTCDELSRAANAEGDRLIKEANQADLDYDARTQHGRTQGARFP